MVAQSKANNKFASTFAQKASIFSVLGVGQLKLASPAQKVVDLDPTILHHNTQLLNSIQMFLNKEHLERDEDVSVAEVDEVMDYLLEKNAELYQRLA